MKHRTPIRQVDVAQLEQTVRELASVASIAFDSTGRIAWVDAGAEQLFGVSADDAIGQPLSAFLPNIDHAAITAEPLRIPEADARPANGVKIRVSVRAKRSPGGLGIAVVQSLDLEDRELRESREMLQAIADGTTAVIYIKDAEGCYVFVNRRFEGLFDIRNEWLRGKTDYDIFPRETADTVRANDEIVRTRRAPVEFDEIVPRHGEPRQYISIKVPLLAPDGHVYAVCGISTDVTERKLAERELLETYEQLRRLSVDRNPDGATERRQAPATTTTRQDRLAMQFGRLIAAARDGVWTINTKGITTFVNPRMAKMLGYTVDEMVGRVPVDFASPRSRTIVEEAVQRYAIGVAEDIEVELQRKDESTVWVLASVAPIRNSNGEVAGALALVTDFTERKRAEEHQLRLVRELDHRVKNSLALVSALADLSMAGATSVSAFRPSFRARLQALARTHEALARMGWADIGFDAVVALVMAPHRDLPGRRIETDGPAVQLTPNLVTPIALALNELATNALKHGALAQHGGTVEIRWSITAERQFSLNWREHAEQTVIAPETEGVGLKLLRGLVEHELGGAIESEFTGDGFRCMISFRLDDD